MEIDGYSLVTDPSRASELSEAYAAYVADIGNAPSENVWYDHKNNICFGLDTTYASKNRHEAAVLTDKKTFLFDRTNGAASISSFYGQLFPNVEFDE